MHRYKLSKALQTGRIAALTALVVVLSCSCSSTKKIRNQRQQVVTVVRDSVVVRDSTVIVLRYDTVHVTTQNVTTVTGDIIIDEEPSGHKITTIHYVKVGEEKKDSVAVQTTDSTYTASETTAEHVDSAQVVTEVTKVTKRSDKWTQFVLGGLFICLLVYLYFKLPDE